MASFVNFEDLPMIDENIVKENKFLQDSYNTMQQSMKKIYLNWAQIVLDLTDDKEEISSYVKVFQESMEETSMDLINEMNELRLKCCSKLEAALRKMEDICKSLQIPMPSCGKNHLCLRQEYFLLNKQLQEYEQIYKTRIEETNSLREKQLDLCKTLGQVPKILKENPLPSATELDDFKEYIENLEHEVFLRKEKMCQAREEIMKLVQELSFKPSLKFQKKVISDTDLPVNDKNMGLLEEFRQQLIVELKNVKEEIADCWTKVLDLWNLLDIELIERQKFKDAHQGHSLVVLEALRMELSRCDDLKKANIEKFITTLRDQIQEMWQKCHISKEQGLAGFQYFDVDHHSETVLQLFEIELLKWKTYHDENKEIIQLLNKHRNLWDKMLELQENANVGRFKNRGGQLLKEERERNKLCKSIPKIEVQLRDLCDKFKERHGKPFMTFGHSVNEYLEHLHENWENIRKTKLSARKTPSTTTTPGPARKTPKTPPTLKRQLQLPSYAQQSNNKTKVSSPGMKKQMHAVLKTTVSVGKRHSNEFKKRMGKIRRSSAVTKQRLDESDDDEYVDFINEISEKPPGARSTTFTLEPHEEEQPCTSKQAAPRRTPQSKPNNETEMNRARSPSKRDFKLII